MKKFDEISSSKEMSIPLCRKSSKKSSERQHEYLFIVLLYFVFLIGTLAMNFVLLKLLLEKFKYELFEAGNYQKAFPETYEAPWDVKMNLLQKTLNGSIHVTNENSERLPEESYYNMVKADQQKMIQYIDEGEKIHDPEFGHSQFYIDETTLPSDYDDEADDDYGHGHQIGEKIIHIDPQMFGNLLQNMQGFHHLINGGNNIRYVINEAKEHNQEINYPKLESGNKFNSILLNKIARVQNKYKSDRFNSSVPLQNAVEQKNIKNDFKINHSDTREIKKDENNKGNVRRNMNFADGKYNEKDNNDFSLKKAKFIRASFENKNKIRIIPGAHDD